MTSSSPFLVTARKMQSLSIPRNIAGLVKTHVQKGNDYDVKCAYVPQIGATAYWLERGKRKPNNHNNPPGPQYYMQEAASTSAHTFWAAFDVADVSKAFASYVDDRAFYNALFGPQRSLPQHVLNTSYEIVREKFSCWPHWDIEWDPAVHCVEDVHALVLLFEDLVLEALVRYFPFKCSSLQRTHFRVLRSRSPGEKCSFHLILRAGVAFGDSATHHHAFTQCLFRDLVLALVLDGDLRLLPLFFNRKTFTVKVGGGCIFDTQIYTRNREFRPCGAVKLSAPGRVLVPFDLHTGKEIMAPENMSYEQWSEYLVSNVPAHLECEPLAILRATAQMLAFSADKTPPVSVNSIEQEALRCYFDTSLTRSTTDEQLRDGTSQRRYSANGANTQKRNATSASVSDNSVAKRPSVAEAALQPPEQVTSLVDIASYSGDSNSSCSNLSEGTAGRLARFRNRLAPHSLSSGTSSSSNSRSSSVHTL